MNRIILTTVIEDDRRIIFSPSLDVEYFQLEEFIYEVSFDFGMNFTFNVDSPITRDCIDPLDKLRRIIEFELMHSFFHFKHDPNYSILNWALYGNLKDRVKCEEREISDADFWGFENKLKEFP
jgi:hypothetical protein